MHQRELDFTDAARLEQHLLRCGLSRVQAGLAGLVLRDGTRSAENEIDMRLLKISSRSAAGLLNCNDRSVRDAAATLMRSGWFYVLSSRPRTAPTYCLDVVKARSLAGPEQQLDAPPQDVVGAECCGVAAGCCGVLRGAARVLPERSLQNPCLPSIPSIFLTRAELRSPQHPAATPQELWPLPWSAKQGLTDQDLRAAVTSDDIELLGWLYATARELGWISGPSIAAAPDGDVWLRFLVGSHHAATARLYRRMGRLVAFVKGDARRGVPPLDVSRMGRASEDWARRLIASQFRNPALAGRLMQETPDE